MGVQTGAEGVRGRAGTDGLDARFDLTGAGPLDLGGDRPVRRRSRDRRGHGSRGPAVLPQVAGEPMTPTRREHFDELVLGIVAEVDDRWQSRLGLVEYAVEDTPVLPATWHDEQVPLATVVHGRSDDPVRLVLFRRPIEHRAETRADLEALVLTVVVEQVADLLGMDPEDVDPRYGPA